MLPRNSMAPLPTLLVFLAVWLLSPPAATAGYSPVYKGTGYKYRTYSYYSPTYRQVRKHYVVYRPSQPRYVYYYNPYTRKYWGRYDRQTGLYSQLANADKKATISEIPESAFPPGGAMPPAEPGDETPMPPPPEPEPEPEPRPTPTPLLPMPPSFRGGVYLPPGAGGCHK